MGARRPRALWAAIGALLLAGGATPAAAHPLAPSLLEIREGEGGAADVVWQVARVRARGAADRPVLPESCVTTVPPTREVEPTRVVERWSVACGAEGLVGKRVGVAGLERGRTDALVRIILADGRTLRFVARPGAPSFEVPARESALEVAKGYLALGAEHILGGPDHLLFVFGLLLLASGRRALVWTITAFTVGHSVTLSLATLGWLKFPAGPIEVLIALSILVLALELARGERAAPTFLRRRPWLMSFVFGLLHGLGFAGALRAVGLPEEEIPAALVAFNVGIELGQLLFITVVLAAERLLRAPLAWLPAWSAWLPVYTLGSLAFYWCLERSAALFP